LHCNSGLFDLLAMSADGCVIASDMLSNRPVTQPPRLRMLERGEHGPANVVRGAAGALEW
jgi:hypothetical protein